MSEYGTKMRLLRVLLAIVEHPGYYTKARLSDLLDTSKDTIGNYFDDFRNAGLLLEYDSKYRYSFIENKPYKQFKDLLLFSEEDQLILMEAIDQVNPHSKRGQKLKKKLTSLYDYHRLGHSYLRKPYLDKVDNLLDAKDNKKQVVLVDYRSSNSNNISNRLVEPFHVSPAEDTLQAFDVNKKALRHYRMSRIKRVKLTEENWAFEGHHNIIRTDPFRIVDDHQVAVHLRIRIGAYNELIERFPATKRYMEETEEEEIYDFQCDVNHQFLGLSNFILGFYHQLVEVVHPESLKEHLRREIERMEF